MNTILHTPSYESSLSQAERLALCAGRFSPSVLGCDDEPLVRTIAAARFPSPRMAMVRGNDGWLALNGSSVNVGDDPTDEETDEEGELVAFAVSKRGEAMREHSFRLPSQRGYAEAWQTAREYGFASE